ncbi:MAG: hypothetical protein GY861_02655 [bacterium]|nr:hypothetical protein [bacterium]
MPKQATKAEKAHMDKVASLGCCLPNCGQPAIIHHVRKHGSKRDHMKVIPLCPMHHRNEGEFGVAIHAGKNEWEKNFGTEESWLKVVGYRIL